MRKRIIRFAVLSIAFAFLLLSSGCGRANSPSNDIQVMSTSYNIPYGGDSKYVSVSSERDWTVHAVAEWCVISDKTQSGFRFEVFPNENLRDRTGYIQVFNGYQEVMIKVFQEANRTVIIIPDAELLAYFVKYLDDNKDGLITVNEALSAISINVPGKAIRSLTGLEYFKNVTSISVDDNQIKDIPLSNLSNLKYLSCTDNDIKYLDLSHNPLLTSVYCKNNPLTLIILKKGQSIEKFSYPEGCTISYVD